MATDSVARALAIAAVNGGGGGGAVDSVNGKTGVVVLTGADINLNTDLDTPIDQTILDIVDELSDKQDILTAGEGIIIENDEITYDPEVIANVDYVDANISDTMGYILDNCQKKLTAGTGIAIDEHNVISVTFGDGDEGEY